VGLVARVYLFSGRCGDEPEKEDIHEECFIILHPAPRDIEIEAELLKTVVREAIWSRK